MLALNYNFKRKLQTSNFIYNISLCGSSYKDAIPYCIVRCFENRIASDKNHWNNCTVAHISLKLHKPVHHTLHKCSTTAQTF